jgi:hypothetical protein
MEIYLGDLKMKKEDNQLMQLKGICENMMNITNESLNDITEEEFQRRCEESSKDRDTNGLFMKFFLSKKIWIKWILYVYLQQLINKKR